MHCINILIKWATSYQGMIYIHKHHIVFSSHHSFLAWLKTGTGIPPPCFLMKYPLPFLQSVISSKLTDLFGSSTFLQAFCF